MQDVSAAFLSAIRGPHTLDVVAQAWRGSPPVRVGGTLRVLGGQVEQSATATSAPRRTLTLELDPSTPGLWGALAPVGTTLLVWRGVRFPDGTTERVLLGVFDVDEQTFDYSADGTLTLTAPDMWARVARARFEAPRVTPPGSAIATAVALAREAIGEVDVLGGVTVRGVGSVSGSTGTQVRSHTWAANRDEAVEKLADSAGAWVFTDQRGAVTARAVPSLTQAPVWDVDASTRGVLLSASRARSRQRAYNVVVIAAGEVNGVTPFTPVTVADDDTASPTWVGGDFGRVPYFMTSQLITSTNQATIAGQARLRRVKGLAAQLSLTAVVNPALECGDVVTAGLPARGGSPAVSERHLIDSVTIPLTADGTQQITTRSTRPEGDVPDDTGGSE